jgi:hypothetical protein
MIPHFLMPVDYAAQSFSHMKAFTVLGEGWRLLQRVLAGQTLDQVVAERLTAKPALAKAKPSGRAGPCDITKARLIAESAEEVSQPDIQAVFKHCFQEH